MRNAIGSPITRRQLLSLGVCPIAAAVSAAACRIDHMNEGALMTRDEQQKQGHTVAREGRLLARPKQVERGSPLGLQALGLDRKRDGLLYVPAEYRAERPAPLAVMLHGSGSNARRGLALLKDFADAAGLMLLAPQSRQYTWDAIVGRYGPDVAFIDQALAQVFSRYSVDPKRLAVGGFSDGASYALALGLLNGELFTHIIAFSPGFLSQTMEPGAPRIFISHGTRDEVLPINVCSRKIVPRLKRAGYDVRYREFDGPHAAPPEIVREAVDWFFAKRELSDAFSPR